jgi:outer membrane protein
MNQKMMRLAATSAAALVSSIVHAQSAGSNVVTLGWLHVSPLQSSTAVTTDITPEPVDSALRLPQTFTSPGTGVRVSNTDTVGLTTSHFFTDNIAVTTIAGIPPLVSIKAEGEVIPPGPGGTLGKLNIGDPALNPIVKSARAWTPALLFQYYFGHANDKLRPFVGLGATYVWFSDVQLSNNFISAVRNSMGAPLAATAGKPGLTQVEAKASTSWQPVANAGVIYNLTPRLGLIASLTYIPLNGNAVIYIKAHDGTMLAQSKSKLSVNPLISYLGVTYTF